MNLQIKLLVAILFISANSFAQKKAADSVDYIYKYPFAEGYIYNKKDASHKSIPFIFIYSKANDVFSLAEGKVERVFRIEEEDLVLIRKGDTTFQYSNLDSTVVTVGNTVQKGELIGKVKKNIDYDRYELIFGMVVGTKKMVYPDYAKFLKNYNN
jgi:peptidase M23-like protein